MKVLIIGADGQLAFDLIRVFKKRHKVAEARRSDFDVTEFEAAEKFILKTKPNLIINTAAFQKTEECEKNPNLSFSVNGIGQYNVSKAAAKIGAISVFISTDYVFDGSKKGFSETDFTNPLNVYGASKLTGEILTKIANDKFYIIRSSWLFGIKNSGKGYNFVDLMINKAKSGGDLKVVNDQFGSPTYTFDLATKMEELISKKAPFGIYHITNSGTCTWYEFAKEILKKMKLRVKLTRIKTNDSGSLIKRPKYSILKNKAITKIRIKKLRPWQKALDAYLKEKYSI